jgi:hypothetical protein
MDNPISLSTQSIMLVAMVSALCRAGLNLVDRYQIGIKGMSIVLLNVLNNALPAIALTMVVYALGLGGELAENVLDWRTACFSGLIQGVAFAFSYAFRHLNVSQVTVAGKAADIFIPMGVFLVTGTWNWMTYAFALTTTLACLPLLRGNTLDRNAGRMRIACALIGGALVLQASLAPLLVAPDATAWTTEHAFVFATAVIVWRMAWSFVPMLRRQTGALTFSWAFLISPLFMLRVLLSVATQITFVLAVGNPASALAWPILNSTGMLAMVLSAFLLKEKPARSESRAVLLIFVLALLRFFSL